MPLVLRQAVGQRVSFGLHVCEVTGMARFAPRIGMRGAETLRWQRVLHEPSPADAEAHHRFKLPEMTSPSRPFGLAFLIAAGK